MAPDVEEGLGGDLQPVLDGPLQHQIAFEPLHRHREPGAEPAQGLADIQELLADDLSANRHGPFSQVGVLHPAKVGRILVASSRAGLEPHALVLVTAHDKAPAREDLARQQRWRGIQDHKVHPTLCRSPEILGQPVEQRGGGQVLEEDCDIHIAAWPRRARGA